MSLSLTAILWTAGILLFTVLVLLIAYIFLVIADSSYEDSWFTEEDRDDEH